MNLQSTTPSESNDSRVETLATRITTEEMRAIKAAAKDSGSSCSEWLREAALAHLQGPNKTSDTPIELTILEELMGFRLLMINLVAKANPGVALQIVDYIVAHADGAKHQAAEAVRRSSEGQGKK